MHRLLFMIDCLFIFADIRLRLCDTVRVCSACACLTPTVFHNLQSRCFDSYPSTCFDNCPGVHLFYYFHCFCIWGDWGQNHRGGFYKFSPLQNFLTHPTINVLLVFVSRFLQLMYAFLRSSETLTIA